MLAKAGAWAVPGRGLGAVCAAPCAVFALPSRKMPAAEPAPPLPACPNCGQAFERPTPRFCPACGQETRIQAPTVGEFLQQFSGTYFATEGAFWRTLKLLVLKPGELTNEYFRGRRKHYVLPLRLFLSVSLVMLLTMRIVAALDFAQMDDPEVTRALPERPRSVQLQLGFGEAGLEDGRYYCSNLPAWLCRRIERRLDVDTRSMMLQMQKASERVATHAGAAAFVLLPGFAFGLWLLFRGAHRRYTEHLVFALHLHAFWFLLGALMMLGVELLAWGCLLLMPAYGALAMRHVYGGPWLQLLLRGALLGSVHLMLVAGTVAALALAALLV